MSEESKAPVTSKKSKPKAIKANVVKSTAPQTDVDQIAVDELLKAVAASTVCEDDAHVATVVPAAQVANDELDTPDFRHQDNLLTIKLAEEEMMAKEAAAPNRMDKLGSVFPPAADGPKTSKSNKLSAEEARDMVHRLFVSYIESGLADLAPIVPSFEALSFVFHHADEKGKVAKILGVRAAYLWSALETLEKRASENLARIGKDRNAKEFFANRKNLWIDSAINKAKYVLNLKHNTLLPSVGVEFKPQWMDSDLRKKIQDLLVDLQKVSRFATCANDGKALGIDRSGNPYTLCVSCRDAKLKADKAAQELLELNLKLEEKKNLLLPLEDLMAELSAAGSYWVADYRDRLKRFKAGEAFDNAFAQQLKWYADEIAGMYISIVTGKISDADRLSVEKMSAFMNATLEEIRTFQHHFWCSDCGAPVYPKPNKRIKSCESCQRVSKINAAQTVAAIDPEVKQIIKTDAEMAGISLHVDGVVAVGASESLKPETPDDYPLAGVFTDAIEQSGEGLNRFNKRLAAADRERKRRAVRGE